MRYCPNCNSLNLDFTEVCMNCNLPLDRDMTREGEPQGPGPKGSTHRSITEKEDEEASDDPDEPNIDDLEALLDSTISLLKEKEQGPSSEGHPAKEPLSKGAQVTGPKVVKIPEDEVGRTSKGPQGEGPTGRPEDAPSERPPDELDIYLSYTRADIKRMKKGGKLKEIIENAIVELREQGWMVDSLEETLLEDIEYGWDLFLKFKKNLKRIPDLKDRMDKLYARGYVADIRSIQAVIKDLELTDDVEEYIKNLEANANNGAPINESSKMAGVHTPASYNDADTELEYGKDAYMRGAYKQAIISFRNVLKMRPDDTSTASLLKRALILNRCKHVQLVGTKRFGEEEPEGDLVSLYENKGVLQDNEEIQAGALMLQRTPEEVEAMGYNEYINQNFRAAEKYFTLALEMEPGLKRAAFRLKICKKKLSKAS